MSAPHLDPARVRPRPPRAPYRCLSCSASWTGLAACHCTGCHRTFSSPSAFDRHRTERGARGECIDPAAVGLELGVPALWRWPGQYPAPAVDVRAVAA